MASRQVPRRASRRCVGGSSVVGCVFGLVFRCRRSWFSHCNLPIPAEGWVHITRIFSTLVVLLVANSGSSRWCPWLGVVGFHCLFTAFHPPVSRWFYRFSFFVQGSP
jgi:hypothetical protein